MTAHASNIAYRITIFLLFSIGCAALCADEAFGQPAPTIAGSVAHCDSEANGSATLNPWEQLPPVTFPRAGQNKLASPDGRYLVENVDGSPPRQGDRVLKDWHTIYLIDTKGNARKTLYRYGRWLNILWSPSSGAFVVNDFYVSDDSHCILFILKPKLVRIDLVETLAKSLKPGTLQDLVTGGYPVFKFAVKWRHAESLLLKVTGFGDVDETGFHHPFVYLFLYRLDGSIQLYLNGNTAAL